MTGKNQALARNIIVRHMTVSRCVHRSPALFLDVHSACVAFGVLDTEFVARRRFVADTIWQIVTIVQERQKPTTSLTVSVSTSNTWIDCSGGLFANPLC